MERAPAAGVATGTPDSGPLATATHAGALPAITPWPATSPLECRGQTWSIIILCYNEAATICRVATAVKSVMEEIAPGRHEIIIVDDGSDDGSVDIVGELGRTVPSVEAICHHANFGIGRALTTGYRRARNDNVCAVPGDGQFDVRELIPFSSVPERTCIAFYRIDNTTYSLFRNGLSYLNKQVNRLALGVDLKDVNWVKVYKTSELRKLTLRLSSSLVESEICAKLIRRRNTIHEVPSSYLPRQYGKSKGASLKAVAQAAKETLKLIVEVRRSALLGERGSGSRSGDGTVR